VSLCVRGRFRTSFPYGFPLRKLHLARSVRNAKLDTRSARSKCEVRREPYWVRMDAGAFVGYRRLSSGSGSWIARLRDSAGKQQHYQALGSADDVLDADGKHVFTFGQAQDQARGFFDRKRRELAGHIEARSGPVTVGEIVKAYLGDRRNRGSKGVRADEVQANARVIPALGALEAERLTKRRLDAWLLDLANSPRRVRTGRFSTSQATRDFDHADSDEVRRRRSTANRVLNILKAALNHAFHEGQVASDDAWRRVKPFREADAAVVHFLSADECRRLVNTCESAFRNLVKGALLTGCRYGELTRMQISDFNGEAGTITVRESKAGKPRHVALNDEGRELFRLLTAGRTGRDLVFTRDDGAAWGTAHQARPLDEACARAKIEPPATFHILRHTYASALAGRGVPMGVIAAQLGHADTRMTEKHYAHLSPNYVADTVRAALPPLGLSGEADRRVMPLRPSGEREVRG
jgi:integrase